MSTMYLTLKGEILEAEIIKGELSELEGKLYNNMVQSITTLLNAKKIGIAFSGGVDSALLAKISYDLGYDPLLLTIGFENSHDVEFSKIISKLMGLKHETEFISINSFPNIAKKIWNIIKTNSLSWNENCIAFYYVSHLAKKHNIEFVLTANGIDELFCGYNSYRLAVDGGEKAVATMMKEKLENEIKMMKTVNLITSEFNVKILQPFLSQKFIDFAKNIPLDKKIKDSNDLMRKHIIRKLAILTGVPKEAALKRKKAMQYGSLIHKNLIKIKTWNSTS